MQRYLLVLAMLLGLVLAGCSGGSSQPAPYDPDLDIHNDEVVRKVLLITEFFLNDLSSELGIYVSFVEVPFIFNGQRFTDHDKLTDFFLDFKDTYAFDYDTLRDQNLSLEGDKIVVAGLMDYFINDQAVTEYVTFKLVPDNTGAYYVVEANIPVE